MSEVTISITDLDITEAVRQFCLSILADGVDAFLGQDNRVPEPLAPDFIIMTMTGQERLATNVETTPGGPLPVELTMGESTQFAVQLDIHGPNSGANAARVAMVWRSAWAASFLAALPVPVAPLYASEPTQTAFDNAENQIETRWIVTVYLQANPVVTVPQDYAEALSVSLFKEADV